MDDLNFINIGTDKITALLDVVLQYGVVILLKTVTAILIWIVGRWLIGVVVNMVRTSLTRQKFDPTVLRYLGSFITVVLNIFLVIAILSYCGIETTSLAALLAAVGLAIGMAWSGLLANLAAGGFIIVLRPFKVGDLISAADVTGTVMEIGLFVTSINTLDNVLTMVGNNKVFAGNIVNFSSNPFRRMELTVTLPASVNEHAVISTLKQQIGSIPDVLANPEVDINLSAISADALTLSVRPYCHNDHYWAVYYKSVEVIRDLQRNISKFQTAG